MCVYIMQSLICLYLICIYDHTRRQRFLTAQVAVLGEQEVAKILEGFNRLSVRGEFSSSLKGTPVGTVETCGFYH